MPVPVLHAGSPGVLHRGQRTDGQRFWRGDRSSLRHYHPFGHLDGGLQRSLDEPLVARAAVLVVAPEHPSVDVSQLLATRFVGAPRRGQGSGLSEIPNPTIHLGEYGARRRSGEVCLGVGQRGLLVVVPRTGRPE